jgi:hypothetical protein
MFILYLLSQSFGRSTTNSSNTIHKMIVALSLHAYDVVLSTKPATETEPCYPPSIKHIHPPNFLKTSVKMSSSAVTQFIGELSDLTTAAERRLPAAATEEAIAVIREEIRIIHERRTYGLQIVDFIKAFEQRRRISS